MIIWIAEQSEFVYSFSNDTPSMTNFEGYQKDIYVPSQLFKARE